MPEPEELQQLVGPSTARGGERSREDLEADAPERRDAGVSHAVHLVDAVEPDRHRRRHSASPRRTADADAVLMPAAETRSPIASVTAEAALAASTAFRSTRSFVTPTATLGPTEGSTGAS